MQKQGNLEVVLRFLQSAFLIDAGIAAIVGIICFAIGLVTLEAFGTFLTWAGYLVIFLACFTGMGGFAARSKDVTDYSLTGAGNMTDNLRRIAEAGNSSLGCFFLLIIASLGLIGVGSLLEHIAVLP